MLIRSVALCAAVWSVQASVLGAGPEDQAKYQEKDTFTCTDGSATISWGEVNNNYCDCSDGSDEPGTSACSDLTPRLTFWCENKGHKGEYIAQTYINDGICDCCDGTDEYGTDAACVNNCVEVATVHAKERAEAEARLAAGLAKKAQLIQRAKEIITEKKASTQQWETELVSVKSDLETAEVVKNTEEAIERSERDEIRKKSEEERVEHDKKSDLLRAEMAKEDDALRTALQADLATHGKLVKGGAVKLHRDIEFRSRGTVPKGEEGTVVGFEGGAGDEVHEDEEEPREHIDSAAAETEPEEPRPIIKLKTLGFSFVAGELDVVPTAKQVAAEEAKTEVAPVPNVCNGFKQTGNCDPEGNDEGSKQCGDRVTRGISGRCECADGTVHKVTCDHDDLTCQHMCETNGQIGTAVTEPCPAEFPYPSAAGSENVLKVCYNTKELAEAGTGPCGSWCGRDIVWWNTNRCTWGCDCGVRCGPADPEKHEDIVPRTVPEFVLDTGASYTRKEAEDARRSYNDLKTRSDDLTRQISDNGVATDINFGPDNEFLPLKGECFELPTPDYTYKFCPFDGVYQGHTNMGKWASWGKQTYGAWGGQDDLNIMKYDNGQTCWSGPARSTEIRVVCGAENVIKSVAEPSMCTYTMVWETPAACVTQ
eukprot:TRINITY_DN13698_c0_g1_i1.p1 TRINITY_DN13698_c0_g1~~TRINITY_DN13698_c0_g1_i1.p1  ORF type:complete len:652 (+),score=255.22 TRINITY_DN13698_c0_g1_i1:45-2000(+)